MLMKLFTLSQVETRRLVCIIGLLFALVIALQYFDLPYSSFVSTLGATVNGPRSSPGFDTNLNKPIEAATDERDGKPAGKTEDVVNFDAGRTREEMRAPVQSFDRNVNAAYNNSSTQTIGKETRNVTEALVHNDVSVPVPTPAPAPAPVNTVTEAVVHKDISALPPVYNVTEPPMHEDASAPAPAIAAHSEPSVIEKRRKKPEHPTEKGRSGNAPARNRAPETSKMPPVPVQDVYKLSDMNNLLIQSRESFYSEIPKWSAAVDRELHDAVLKIENAPIVKSDPYLYAPIYRNISMFKRSYELMEKTLKVYVYKEGERPILHTPVLKGIYASEGWFMKQMEGNKKFVTKDSRKAHLFYLPFSSRMLEEKLYVVNSHTHKNMVEYLKNYVSFIAGKYPHWNRTGGADHFLVACHDWAPSETKEYMAKCIRALCNADVKEGFVFGKDVSLPETNVIWPKDPLKNLVRSKSHSKKTTLAFFAGSMHGPLRSILLQHWENKDPNMKIFGRLPRSKGNKNYVNYMKSSKYCICAKGYEVNSPRVVEAIFYECVPVIISDNFVPPFFETLKWESFAVFVAEKDVPELKKILLSIPEKKYERMQMMVKRVQQHFLWHSKPQKYDIFHMILHSIWHNRLHRIRTDS